MLRKRFCRTFNFELQAAATEEGIILSLGPSHSFALEEVYRYLNPKTVHEVLTQAVLDSPEKASGGCACRTPAAMRSPNCARLRWARPSARRRCRNRNLRGACSLTPA